MKRGYKYLCFFAALFLLASSGCTKPNLMNEGQKVLFQYDYVNYSAGFQHYGFIIDAEGNILQYDKPEKWNLPDEDNKLSQTEIEENIASCVPSGRKIPVSELQKSARYIDNIASSKVSARRRKGNDIGTHTWYCFQYSETESGYKAIVIRTEGDFESENLNFYSRRIIEWMKAIRGTEKK